MDGGRRREEMSSLRSLGQTVAAIYQTDRRRHSSPEVRLMTLIAVAALSRLPVVVPAANMALVLFSSARRISKFATFPHSWIEKPRI